MSQPVTVRLPDTAAEELRVIAHREHRSVSEIGARFIDEGLRQQRFHYIEFRSFNGERHACFKGALQIWHSSWSQKAMKWMRRRQRRILTSLEKVQAGFQYYEIYPEEIDRALEENDLGYERLKALFPNIQLVSTAAQTLGAGD